MTEGDGISDGSGSEDLAIPGIVRSFGDRSLDATGASAEANVVRDARIIDPVSSADLDRDSVNDGSERDRGGIITARGTAEGLVLRIESSVSTEVLRRSLREFMESRRNFVAGNDLIVEWSDERPLDPLIAEMQEELSREFEVRFKESRVEQRSRSGASPSSLSGKQRSPSLFDGIEALGISSSGARGAADRTIKERSLPQSSLPQRTVPPRAAPSTVWDDADARMIYGTLRSGQRVETEHSIVVLGDVNSGAEIVAGGDVIVMGCLRGIAHAGAYDETGGGRMIFALNLEPTQLRIGGVISRGGASEGYAGPEVARVDGSLIIVEAYQSRATSNSRR